MQLGLLLGGATVPTMSGVRLASSRCPYSELERNPQVSPTRFSESATRGRLSYPDREQGIIHQLTAVWGGSYDGLRAAGSKRLVPPSSTPEVGISGDESINVKLETRGFTREPA